MIYQAAHNHYTLLGMTKVVKALEFANEAHTGQIRKYTDEPYINHPIAVASTIQSIYWKDESVISAALLHDVVEDTPVTIQDIEESFGPLITKLVEGLTDVYTSKAFPKISRKERKKLECWRLFNCSGLVKEIKLADLIDNTISIVNFDPEFAKVYIKEKEELIQALETPNAYSPLLTTAILQIIEAKKQLGIV